jgi:hypothetical protein
VGRSLEVVPLVWDDPDDGFIAWFRDAWKPGQHVSVIAPTGAGKTTFVGGILGLRRYVLAFDPKGGDSTLMGLGLPRLDAWPGNRRMAGIVNDNDEDGKPSRYIVGPRTETRAERPKLIEVMRDALVGAFDMGGWTVYADELQILTDPRLFNLRADADEILIAARDKKLSFVSSYQAPSWVTPHAAKMSTWVAVSYTRDSDVQNRIAEICGRPKAEIRGYMDELEEFTWMVVGRNPREPVRVTLPPEILAA